MEKNRIIGPREEIGREVGAISDEKGRAYGDSISATMGVMNVIYPEGISVESYESSLVVIRIIDKLNRIANGSLDAFSEDPWLDIAGYAILMVDRNRS